MFADRTVIPNWGREIQPLLDDNSIDGHVDIGLRMGMGGYNRTVGNCGGMGESVVVGCANRSVSNVVQEDEATKALMY